MRFNPLSLVKPGQEVKIILARSPIGSLQRHKDCLRTLGLRKIRQSRVVKLTPSVFGIVQSCVHLLKIEEVSKV